MVGVVVAAGDLPVPLPQASENRMKDPVQTARANLKTRPATWWRAADTLIFLQTSACRGHTSGSSGGKPVALEKAFQLRAEINCRKATQVRTIRELP